LQVFVYSNTRSLLLRQSTKTLERDDYEAILKREGVEIKNAYPKEEAADPTKI